MQVKEDGNSTWFKVITTENGIKLEKIEGPPVSRKTRANGGTGGSSGMPGMPGG